MYAHLFTCLLVARAIRVRRSQISNSHKTVVETVPGLLIQIHTESVYFQLLVSQSHMDFVGGWRKKVPKHSGKLRTVHPRASVVRYYNEIP